MSALYFLALGVCVLHDRRVDRRRVAAGLPRLDGTMADEPGPAAGTA
jgi:sec-independent protein translocase protein TatC